MDIEEVRRFALSLDGGVTEELFAEQWISWLIGGKWFLLMQLDAPEPRVAVKLPPAVGEELRDSHDGVRPAYHMNKTHWLGVLLDGTAEEDTVKTLLEISYDLTAPKPRRKERNHD